MPSWDDVANDAMAGSEERIMCRDYADNMAKEMGGKITEEGTGDTGGAAKGQDQP